MEDSKVEYTGKYKFRAKKRWWRREPLLILQMQFRYTGEEMRNSGGIVDSVPYDFKLWEDAKISDMGDFWGHKDKT